MPYVTHVIDHDGERDLTEPEYAALRARDGEYDWVLDGVTSPPVCRRGSESIQLGNAEFQALARLIHARGEVFPPRRLVPDAVSPESANQRFLVARNKVEWGAIERSRKTRAFRTVGRGDDLRYKFEPSAQLRYCLAERVERAAPSEIDPSVGSVAIDAPEASSSPSPPLFYWRTTQQPGLLGHLLPKDGGARPTQRSKRGQGTVDHAAPRPPRFVASPSPEEVAGIEVQVRSLDVGGDTVRARVTITNRTPEPKLVAFFTLRVGDCTVRAFLPSARVAPPAPVGRGRRSRKRLPRSSGTRGTRAVLVSDLNPMMPLEAQSVVNGVLVFPLPAKESGAVTIRPHVLVGPIEG